MKGLIGGEWMDYLREVNTLSIVIRLTLALICGGIIGIDRGRKRRPAGFRTHVLVCIGSALAMLTNQYIVQEMNIGGDPTRLGAQVISGIGFLGAGTILVTGKKQVKGLTTAAGLWASACMGLAIGIGFYEGAIIGCLFIVVGMTILHGIESYLVAKAKVIELYVELESAKGIKHLIDYIKHHEMTIAYMEVTKSENITRERVGILFTLKQHHKKPHEEVISMISQVEQVTFVEEI